ncbi:transmembrane amino acid transporter protein [Ditylenchus destructor]|nr:transmembrane amino acid transporter protein [Ditylenchus destructor]
MRITEFRIFGSGIVALPTAIVQCQLWLGLVLLFVMAVIAITSAVLLGKSWVIMLRRFPIYRTHCRRPYPEIGMRALGWPAKYAVMFCVNFTLFGVTTVFLLLSAKNIRDFLVAFFKLDVSECILIMAVALALLPVTMLKSPKDFWPVVLLGMISTAVAFGLIISGAAIDYNDCSPTMKLPNLKLSNVLLGLGTIRFTYGGHSAFPTIQHDMRDPASFTKSSIFAISIVTLFNYGVVTMSALSYGNSLRDSVINSIQTLWIQETVNAMITLHCLLTVTLVINPLNQSAEDLFRIPQGFGLKRIIARTAMMGAVVFTAETIPSFGSILNLIGSSTITCTSAVFPCLFFLYLSAGEKMSREPKHADRCHGIISIKDVVRRTHPVTLAALGGIIVFSIGVGIIATYIAVDSLTDEHFNPPCYLRSFFVSNTTLEDQSRNQTLAFMSCCGAGQNISRHPDLGMDACKIPEPNLY